MVDRRVERERDGMNLSAYAEVIGGNRGRWLCSKLMEIPLFCIHQLFSYFCLTAVHAFPRRIIESSPTILDFLLESLWGSLRTYYDLNGGLLTTFVQAGVMDRCYLD